MNRFNRLSLYALITGVIYMVWLALVVESFIGYIFFTLEFLMFLLVLLFIVNHAQRRYQVIGGNYSLRSIVDIFIPTKNEPYDMVKKTLEAVCDIEYHNKRVYILDDGARAFIKRLAGKYSSSYLTRPDQESKDYKAANLNYALKHSFGNFILVLDADQVPHPNIIDDLLGHFKDPKVALVATRQRFNVPLDDFNNDHVFYEYMQSGKNEDDVGISCGSGVMYRRTALEAIGGFAEWNIVEDLATSYILHSKGYRSIFVNQSYAVGDAPQDLAVIYKQRGRWALDTLRIFFWRAPLFNLHLRVRARLHYFEIGYIYIVSALVIPAIYYLNYYSILFNEPILTVGIWYLIFKLPSLYFSLRLYDELGQGSSSSRMWAALFPVFLLAAVQAILRFKPKSGVTPKGLKAKRHINIVLPQLITIYAGLFVIAYHIGAWGITPLLTVNIFWFILMIYWLWPVFPLALAKSTK